MKLVAAAALLERALIDPNHKYNCAGHATIHDQTFHCQFPHGLVDLTTAIAVSCNSFFVEASHRLPTSVFLEFAKLLGLAEPVAQLPSGVFPPQSDDASYTFILGLNQTLQPSAVQFLRLAALIAANGKIPYLRSADDMNIAEPFQTKLADSTWRHLEQGMKLAVKDGTARKLDPENKMDIAAKTGTYLHGKRYQSCIVGFFPSKAPAHAFCVWSPAGTSQEGAVPDAHKFLFSTTWP
jgi:cell division protein FtsI/penicillin-binding protein 2